MKFPKIEIKNSETQFENSKTQFRGTFLRGLLIKFLTNNVRILCLKRVKLTLKLMVGFHILSDLHVMLRRPGK